MKLSLLFSNGCGSSWVALLWICSNPSTTLLPHLFSGHMQPCLGHNFMMKDNPKMLKLIPRIFRVRRAVLGQTPQSQDPTTAWTSQGRTTTLTVALTHTLDTFPALAHKEVMQEVEKPLFSHSSCMSSFKMNMLAKSNIWRNMTLPSKSCAWRNSTALQ